jgi:carboxymethylenebutenolidase
VQTEMIQFRGNGDLVPGYLARPDDEGPFPGVVVIQEWWGLNDHIKDVTRRVAAEGYVAVAPDLYRGQVAEEPDDARKLAMELDRPHAIKHIQGAVNYLIAQPFVVPKKPGVMGFCMGGGLSLAMSYQGENVGAIVVFYGGGAPLSNEQVAQVTAPVLGIYGEEDHGIPVETIRTNESLLKAHDKPSEFIIYPGAPHAFFNDERPSYRPDAAGDAWKRTFDWFKQHLKGSL